MAGRTVTVELDGDEYELKYDLNAIAYLGEQLGIEVRLNHIKEDLFDVRLPASSIRTLVYAGLRHTGDDLTEEDVGAMVDQDNIIEVMQSFFALFGDISSDALPENVKSALDEAVADAGVPERASPETSPSATPNASGLGGSGSTPTPSGA